MEPTVSARKKNRDNMLLLVSDTNFQRDVADARKKISDAIESVSPMLIRTAQDYERIARMIAPAIRQIQSYQELTRPMLEDVLRDRQPLAGASITTPRQEDVTPSRASQILDDATCGEIARRVFELIQSEDTKPIARKSYPLPSDAKWEKLRMKFFDGHTLKVSYPGMKPGTFDYKDMGFEDRKTRNPDVKWKFLEAIADGGGRLTVAKFDKKYSRNVKYETAKRLRSFFSMGSDPIPRYSKADGYAPLFVILTTKDAMPLNDDRTSLD
jgi:hypothetical protein